ncbi:hypothetical protein GOODEAATRI_025313 [Goodea atripinnis]|uniref:Uncharacterized protein n=1 Tax=Goodea atripinnis TaxID=208336 RepID=A0ABV0MLU8_9TELE
MTSVGTIRLCPTCNTGYIMSYDLHVICEGCLGPDHANLTLTPQSTCPSCRCLPLEEKQRRLAIFSPLQGEFPVADQCPPLEALDIFGVGRQSDDSAPETVTDISTPFLRTEDAETDAKSVQAQGLPMSATTPFQRWAHLLARCRTSLTDRSHQCAAQVAAATNNTAFLAYAISKKAQEMELPLEDVEEFCNFAHTILNLCSVGCVLLPHRWLPDPATATDVALALLLHP